MFKPGDLAHMDSYSHRINGKSVVIPGGFVILRQVAQIGDGHGHLSHYFRLCRVSRLASLEDFSVALVYLCPARMTFAGPVIRGTP